MWSVMCATVLYPQKLSISNSMLRCQKATAQPLLAFKWRDPNAVVYCKVEQINTLTKVPLCPQELKVHGWVLEKYTITSSSCKAHVKTEKHQNRAVTPIWTSRILEPSQKGTNMTQTSRTTHSFHAGTIITCHSLHRYHSNPECTMWSVCDADIVRSIFSKKKNCWGTPSGLHRLLDLCSLSDIAYTVLQHLLSTTAEKQKQ